MSEKIMKLDLDGGATATVFSDTECEQPFSGDEGVRIVVLHRRYRDPSSKSCGETADEVTAWAEENSQEWFSMPLWLLDHSGVAYAAGHSNPFSDPWDSGRVGIVAIKRAEFGSGSEPAEKLEEYAKGIADAYGEWANGECYGYVIEGSDGSEIDSSWGYVGIEAVREAIKEAAPQPALLQPSL